MMYKANVAVCSEICTKHSAQSEHHVEFFLLFNMVVRKETARLWKVKFTNAEALAAFSSIIPKFVHPHSEKYPDRVSEPIYQERPDIRHNENEEGNLQTRLIGKERKFNSLCFC